MEGQIASHYNWLIEIFHRGQQFYNNHPPEIKEISENIRASDNSDPLVIAHWLETYSHLFLNQQSRLALGKHSGPLTQQLIGERLAGYEMVVTESRLESLVQQMTGHKPDHVPSLNKSKYHFDPGVFDHPQLQKFLQRKNSRDTMLYAYVSDGQSGIKPV